MSSPNCRHVKEDGTYCVGPAVRGHKYCYYHLTHRARRFRRALALSRNEPCPLVLPPFDSIGSLQLALSETVQAVAAGQLDQRSAGLILYAIQQSTTIFLRVAQMQHQAETQPSEGAKPAAQPATAERLEEYPEFERNFDLAPGTDLDAETDRVMLHAQEQAAALSVMPTPQPGSGCPVPAKPYYTREESYQLLQWEVHRLRKQVSEFQQQQKRLLDIAMSKKQPAAAAAPSPNPAVNSA
jgi:hypothetical protein